MATWKLTLAVWSDIQQPQLVAKLLGSAPLPAVKKLRPLPPLPQGSVLVILAAPHPPTNRPSSVLGKASQLLGSAPLPAVKVLRPLPPLPLGNGVSVEWH